MKDNSRNLQEILDRIRASEAMLVKNSIIFVAIICGLTLSLYGTWKASNDKAESERQAQRLALQSKNQTESERFLSMGVALASKGNLTDAIANYRKAIDASSTNSNAYQLMGYALLRKSQIERKRGLDTISDTDLTESIAALNKAIEIDASYTWAYYNLSLAYSEKGEQELAIESIAKLLTLDPSFKETIEGDPQFTNLRRSPEFRKLLNATLN